MNNTSVRDTAAEPLPPRPQTAQEMVPSAPLRLTLLFVGPMLILGALLLGTYTWQLLSTCAAQSSAALQQFQAELETLRLKALLGLSGLGHVPSSEDAEQLALPLRNQLLLWNATLELYDDHGTLIRAISASPDAPAIPPAIRKQQLTTPPHFSAPAADYVFMRDGILLVAQMHLRHSATGNMATALLCIPVNTALLQQLSTTPHNILMLVWSTPPRVCSTHGSGFEAFEIWQHLHGDNKNAQHDSIMMLDGMLRVASHTLFYSSNDIPVAVIAAAVPLTAALWDIGVGFALLCATGVLLVIFTRVRLHRYLLQLRRPFLVVAELLREVPDGTIRKYPHAGDSVASQLYQAYNAMVNRLSHSQRSCSVLTRQYHNLFDNSLSGLFISSPEGRLLDANSSLISMFGYENKEDILTSVRDLTTEAYVDPEKRTEMKALLESQGYVRSFEAQFYRKDKTIFTGLMSVNHFVNLEGDFVYEGSIIDVSQPKEMEQKAQRTAVAQSMRNARAELLAGIGSELLKPAGNISVICSELRALGIPTLAHDLNRLRTASERIRTLAEDILDLSHMEAGTIQLHKSLCDIHTLLSPFRDVHASPVRNVRLALDIAPDMPRRIFTDQTRLRQLLAIFISIETTEQAPCTVQLSMAPAMPLSSADDKTDNGSEFLTVPILFSAHMYTTGLTVPAPGDAQPAESAMRNLTHDLFEGLLALFNGTRPVRPVTSTVPGSSPKAASFILPIAIPVADRASADPISVQKGTLPSSADSDDVLQDTTHGSGPANSLPAATSQTPDDEDYAEVLIVTDSKGDATVLGMHMRTLRVSFRIVNNDDDALVVIRRHSPQFVMLDLEMQGTNGFKLARTIATLWEEMNTVDDANAAPLRPVLIAFTAHPASLVETQCVGCGITHVLTKPFTIAMLHALMTGTSHPGPGGTFAHSEFSSDPAPEGQDEAEVPVPPAAHDESTVDTVSANVLSDLSGIAELLRRAAAGENIEAVVRMLPVFVVTAREKLGESAETLLDALQAHSANADWNGFMEILQSIEAQQNRI